MLPSDNIQRKTRHFGRESKQESRNISKAGISNVIAVCQMWRSCWTDVNCLIGQWIDRTTEVYFGESVFILDTFGICWRYSCMTEARSDCLLLGAVYKFSHLCTYLLAFLPRAVHRRWIYCTSAVFWNLLFIRTRRHFKISHLVITLYMDVNV